MILTLTLLFSCLAGIAAIYHLFCIYLVRRYFRTVPSMVGDEYPPATILIPLCGIDFDAYGNYAVFCRQEYPQFQLIFGVQDEQDPSIAVVRRLMADFPESDIRLVVNANTLGENRKVGNLHNMLAEARYDSIVIVDSDIRAGRDFLRSTVPHLNDPQVGLVTCFYRAAQADNWVSRLEAIEITAEFLPGVVVAREMEGMTFALGAAMVTSRERLRDIGGLEAIADHLADDYMLGHLIYKAGYEVRLVPYVVETVLGPMGFVPMLVHQIRWARVKRVCRPGGYLGLIVTYGTAFALLSAIVSQAAPASLALLAMVVGIRLLVGWLVGYRCFGDEIVKRYLWLIPVRDLVSFLIWCVSLIGRTIEWRGRTFDIGADGRMIPKS
ncbi:MAG TPA: glycosyl transferase [Syntrophobacteraceae bacterium]|nr:glycosyl transferase [Syntrophobacteraceae bacterium]